MYCEEHFVSHILTAKLKRVYPILLDINEAKNSVSFNPSQDIDVSLPPNNQDSVQLLLHHKTLLILRHIHIN